MALSDRNSVLKRKKRKFKIESDSLVVYLVFLATLFLIVLSVIQATRTEPVVKTEAADRYFETVRVAMPENNKPFSFYDEKGHPSGFDVETVNEIANYLRVNVEILLLPVHEMDRAIRDGKADIVTNQDLLSQASMDDSIALTETILRDAYCVFGKERVDSLSDISGRNVSTIKNSGLKNYLNNMGLSEKCLYCDTPESAVLLAAGSGSDFCILRESSGQALLKTYGYRDIKKQFRLTDCYISYGVNSSNLELYQRVNNAIEQLRLNRTLDKLSNKWISFYTDNGTLKETMESNPLVLYFFVALATLLVAAFIAAQILNSRRKKALREKQNVAAVNTLTREYDSLVLIDFKTGKTFNYKVGKQLKSSGFVPDENLTYEESCRRFAESFVIPEDRQRYLERISKEAVLEHVKDGEPYYVNFRSKTGEGAETYYQSKFALADRTGNSVMAGIHSVDSEMRRELAKQEELEEMITARTSELQDKNKALNRMNEEIVELLADLVEGRDKSSGEHVRRVKELTRTLCTQAMKDIPEFHLTERMVNLIASASALHDIGKITIPDNVLKKPGRLTDEEFELMKTHTTAGVDILSMAPGDWGRDYVTICMEICGGHHEKWDGRGYPQGLKGEEIPVSAQVVSIADVFDALTSERVYKKAYSPETAFHMIQDGQCGAFNPKLLASLAKCRRQFEDMVEGSGTQSKVGQYTNLFSDTLDGINILLVDDNDLSRELNQEILEAEGAIVCTAENGEEALRIFQERESGLFDVVLMDLVMPGMNGIETIRRIRAMGTSYAETVPIIGLTGEGTEEQIDSSIDSGADGCMTKPLVISNFTKKLFACMRKRSVTMEKKVADTMETAFPDSLTGVKNITAYTRMISRLTDEVRDNTKKQFAVVMCDINGLKDVNDRFGHSEGDLYIQNCSRLITDTFSTENVFRIGGDEFVIILTGNDYSIREKLIVELRDRVREAEKLKDFKKGKASLAAGMADYNPDMDQSISDVIRRADELMYESKRLSRSRSSDSLRVTEEIKIAGNNG